MTAESLALQFMWLDRKVFGDSVFRITDKRLFKYAASDTARLRLIRLRPQGDLAAASSRMQPVTYTRCYEVVHDGDEGQLVGVEPGGTNNYYWSETVCTTYTLWFDDGTGGSTTPPDGGGGTPTPGGSPGGSGDDGDCPAVAVVTAAKSPPPPGDCGGTGWEPYPVPTDPSPAYWDYVLSDVDYELISQMNQEFEAYDESLGNPTPCHGTANYGSVKFQGNLEHWMIQFDYLRRYPGGALEYIIPQAGANGGNGYADIVNVSTKEIFEIKPDDPTNEALGVSQVSRYATKASENCGVGPWRLGTGYTPVILPYPRDFTKAIKTRINPSGVILYSIVSSSTNPIPVTVPESIRQKIRDLRDKLRTNPDPNDKDRLILVFLRENTAVRDYIKNALYTSAAAIVLGTLVEDLVFELGIADDWWSFMVARQIFWLAERI
jgi:hypothetical protein